VRSHSRRERRSRNARGPRSAIEREASGPDGDRVVVGHLSRKLGIPAETLRGERTQTGLGWGELLIAHRLSGQTGLSIDQTVAEVRSGKGWGEIARDHNADLDTLSRDVQLSQETIEQRSEDKGPHAARRVHPLVARAPAGAAE